MPWVDRWTLIVLVKTQSNVEYNTILISFKLKKITDGMAE